MRRTLLLVLLAALLGAGSCGGDNPAPAVTTAATVTASPVAQSAVSGSSCGAPVRQADQGHDHVVDLNQAYRQHPATSGPHYPVPLPPQPDVYTVPVPEARAVHNLEHRYVWVYYRAPAAGGLTPDAVDALRSAVTSQRKVLMAPYPQLPDGVALDFAAWDQLQQCKSGVSVHEAVATLGSFVKAFREGLLSPEPGAG
ncbi:MAG: DUF3105 domain-containing protein [Candidatus Dormibacteraeota bacterium]|nr:DUF3105 domain-containing protein [Candidatus Dormibacteraeota bacterium]